MAQDQGQAETVKEVAASPRLREERVLCTIGVDGIRVGSVAHGLAAGSARNREEEQGYNK